MSPIRGEGLADGAGAHVTPQVLVAPRSGSSRPLSSARCNTCYRPDHEDPRGSAIAPIRWCRSAGSPLEACRSPRRKSCPRNLLHAFESLREQPTIDSFEPSRAQRIDSIESLRRDVMHEGREDNAVKENARRDDETRHGSRRTGVPARACSGERAGLLRSSAPPVRHPAARGPRDRAHAAAAGDGEGGRAAQATDEAEQPTEQARRRHNLGTEEKGRPRRLLAPPSKPF